MNNKIILVLLILSGFQASSIAMDKENHSRVAFIQPSYWRVRGSLNQDKPRAIFVPQTSLLYLEGKVWSGSPLHFLSLIDEDQLLARVIGLEKISAKDGEDVLSRKPEKQPKNIHIVNGVEIDLDDID